MKQKEINEAVRLLKGATAQDIQSIAKGLGIEQQVLNTSIEWASVSQLYEALKNRLEFEEADEEDSVRKWWRDVRNSEEQRKEEARKVWVDVSLHMAYAYMSFDEYWKSQK